MRRTRPRPDVRAARVDGWCFVLTAHSGGTAEVKAKMHSAKTKTQPTQPNSTKLIIYHLLRLLSRSAASDEWREQAIHPLL